MEYWLQSLAWEELTHMQHIEHQDHQHQTAKGFLLFGGLTVSLAWTLWIVWVGLVSLAEEIRKIQG